MSEEKVYVTHTCKKCESAFMDVDEVDSYVLPPRYKHCPECVSKGFKNTSKDREAYKSVSKCEEYLYRWLESQTEYSQKDATWIYNKSMLLLKEYIKFGKRIMSLSIINQAKEVYGYYIGEELPELEEWY